MKGAYSYGGKVGRSNCMIELERLTADHMRTTGRWVVAEARAAVLKANPILAARVAGEQKGK